MTTPLPFHRRLGVRLALVLFAGLLLVDLAALPLWNWFYFLSTPEWSDPEQLRSYADYLETLSPEEVDQLMWDTSFLESSDLASIVGFTALYAGFFSLLLGCLVSFLATRRIVTLTREASGPVNDPESLPGPFTESGRDELMLLARSMNEMRDEILRLVGEIEERDRRRRDWIAEVSHDLRTPLTALAVLLEQARPVVAHVDGAERERLNEILRSAREDVARVQDYAQDLLEVARLEAGDELRLEPVPAGELLSDVTRELEPVARDRGVRLEADLPHGLPELMADGRRLVRALENLILNSVQWARSRVRIEVVADERALTIAIEDDGPGLPTEGPGQVEIADLQRHLGRRDSAGIGLQVADKVIAAHGGTTVGANRSEGGARWTVRLPGMGVEPE